MQEFYTLHVAGLTRELPLCEVNEHLDIAAFIMFSDVELTVAAATELIKKSPECDMVITAETKGIPLAYEMARQLNVPYFVARKSVKVYTKNPIIVDVESITTKGTQKLILNGDETARIAEKRVLVVDDVISTGESLKALNSLVALAGGTIVGQVAVLAEGDAAERDDIIYLEQLPLFFK